MWGNIIKKISMSFTFEKTPCIGLRVLIWHNNRHRSYHISIHSVVGSRDDYMLDCGIFIFAVVRSMDKAIDKVKAMTRPKDEL